MSQGVWKCDSCHSNNDPGLAACRLCGRSPGSVTGEVPIVTHRPPTASGQQQRPTFGPSAHDRPTVTLTPPARSRPPAPPPLPPPSRGGSGGGGVVLVVIVILVIAVFGVIISSQKSGAPSPTGGIPTPAPTTTTASGGTACPSEVAQWLPSNGPNSTLVARYNAPMHVVTICEDSGGQLYYDGQERGQPATDKYHISLRAWRTSSGYEADNGGYKYLVSSSELELTNNGAEVTRWPLVPAG